MIKTKSIKNEHGIYRYEYYGEWKRAYIVSIEVIKTF